MIIMSFVHDHIHVDKNGKFNVQCAGVSDKPSKLMQLQTWFIPHDTAKEAQKMRDDYQAKLSQKGDTFLVILTSKK